MPPQIRPGSTLIHRRKREPTPLWAGIRRRSRTLRHLVRPMPAPAFAQASTPDPPAAWRRDSRRPTSSFCPQDDALDFLRFCVRNPKPCPLLEVTDTGSPHPTDAGARRRPAHRRAALPGLRRRHACRRADRRDRVLARRPGELPARMLVHVRMGARRCRSAAGASTAGRQRSDVRHRPPLRRRRTVRGSAGGVDETVRTGRHRAARRDLGPLSGDARRTGSYR